MKNKLVIIIIMFCILLFSNNIFAVTFKNLDLSAKNVGVYTVDNLRPLYEKDAQVKTPIASITKIMTAIVCIENVKDLNEEVTVDLPKVKKYYDDDYSVAGLKDKQKITYYDLIATMLLPSGADSAACIALNVFNSYDLFIKEMNKKAKELGMKNTSFANPIGADDEKNYSTVEDVAIMMKYALSNDIIKKFITDYEYTTKDKSITVHNALFQLGKIYGINIDKITGGKTGMTEDAGYCLASYSEELEEPVICIVLGSEIKKGTLYHLSDSQALYEYLKDNFSMRSVVSMKEDIMEIETYHATKNNVPIGVSEDVKYYLGNEEEIKEEDLEIEYIGEEVVASLNKTGHVVGKASVYYKGDYITDVDIVLNEDVKFSIFKWSKDNKGISILVVTIAIILGLFLYKKMKKYKFVNKY